MTFKLPLRVRCIKPAPEMLQNGYPGLDFGTVGQTYMVSSIVPNGRYYVLRGDHNGLMLAEPGMANYIVSMSRFEVIDYMTEKGVVPASETETETETKSETEEVKSNLHNCYGRVTVRRKKSKLHMMLGDHDGPNKIKISREFYDAFKKEFGHDV